MNHHRGALTVYARALGKTPPNLYIDPVDQVPPRPTN